MPGATGRSSDSWAPTSIGRLGTCHTSRAGTTTPSLPRTRPSACDGGRSHSPLRDSPGFPPGSLSPLLAGHATSSRKASTSHTAATARDEPAALIRISLLVSPAPTPPGRAGTGKPPDPTTRFRRHRGNTDPLGGATSSGNRAFSDRGAVGRDRLELGHRTGRRSLRGSEHRSWPRWRTPVFAYAPPALCASSSAIAVVMNSGISGAKILR